MNYKKFSSVLFITFLSIIGFVLFNINSTKADGPISISTCNDFQNINNDLAGSYILANDLNCGPAGEDLGNDIEVATTDPFTGTFDGNNHTVTVDINIRDWYASLFGQTNGATITNLTVAGSIVGGGMSNTGGLIATVNDGGLTLTNDHVTANVSTTDAPYVGGLISYLTNTNNNIVNITGCSTTGIISGYGSVGGLIGQIYDSYQQSESSTTAVNITNSFHTTGAISSFDNNVGGLIGNLYVNNNASFTLTNSYAESDITSDHSNVGGIVGLVNNGETDDTINMTFTGNHFSGNITSDGSNVGGIFGDFDVINYIQTADLNINILNNYSSGLIHGYSGVGGLSGYMDIWADGTYDTNVVVSTNHSDATVSGVDSRVGGLIGDLELSTLGSVGLNFNFNKNYSTSTVTSGANSAGGLIGYYYSDDESGSNLLNATLDQNYFAGASVVGTSYVGGLIGQTYITNTPTIISNSYSTGNVSGSSGAGGFGGYIQDSTITNSYSSGNVDGISAGSDIGGFIGLSDLNNISNSFSFGTLTNLDTGGSFAGGDFGDYDSVNNFYDRTKSGIPGCVSGVDISGCTAVNTDGHSPNYFKGNFTNAPLDQWNFQNIWDADGGHLPTLHNLTSDDVAQTTVQSSIATCADFENINNNLSGDYVLTTDLDCRGEANNIMVGVSTPFSGSFDGQGHTIQIAINDVNDNYSSAGLFNQTNNAIIQNLNITGNITELYEQVGALSGYSQYSIISNVNSSVIVTGGTSYTGGLIGSTINDVVSGSSATGNVISSTDDIGGFIGYDSNSVIDTSFATGNVTVGNDMDTAGGFIGGADNTSILQSYASGNVSITYGGGGFIGYADHVNFQDVYASGNVTSSYEAGGFIGYGGSYNTYTNTYASGNVDGVSGGDSGGGFAGQNGDDTYVNSFSTGSVIHFDSSYGGFAGHDYDSGNHYTNNFYDQIASGQTGCVGTSDISGCNAVNTTDSPNSTYFQNTHSQAPLSAWNFTDVWQTNTGTLPTLQAFGTSNHAVTITGYESHDVEVSPTNPGVLSGNVSKTFTKDGTYWITALSGGGYDSQVYKISKDLTGIVNPKYTINWTGHGDANNTMHTSLYIWNFDTSAWETLQSQVGCTGSPSDCSLSGTKTGTKYNDGSGNTWVWAKAEKAGEPLISNIYFDGIGNFNWNTDVASNSEVVYDSRPHATWQEFLDATSHHDGANPRDALVEVNGIFYGTTEYQGPNGYGTIFSFNPANSTYTVVHNFDLTHGSNSQATMINVSGILYGNTVYGGAYGYGTIFSFDPSNNTYTDVYDFDNTHGANPYNALVDVGGILYGSAYASSNNYGAIYSFNPSNSTYTDIHDFDSTNGANPYTELLNVNGVLYGGTVNAGTNGYGTIFSVDTTNGNAFTKLHDFDNTSGAYPYAGFTDVGGILYGTTQSGGANGQGIIFSFNTSNSTFTDIHNFNGTDGNSPQASLLNVNGILFSTTVYGGVNNQGTVFSFNPSNSTFTDIHDFDGTHGRNPNAPFVESNGTLYGTTYGGQGSIYSINPTNNVFTLKYYINDFNAGYLSALGDSTTSHNLNNGGMSASSLYFMVRSTTSDNHTNTSPLQGPFSASCPYLFTWDGHEYKFITDVSTSGAPDLGMSGALWKANPWYQDPNANSTYAQPLAYAQMPSGSLVPHTVNGETYYDIKNTTELNEVDYYDQAQLQIIDHSANVNVYPDYRDNGTIHTVSKNASAPVSVTDENGRDVKNLVAQDDNMYWHSTVTPNATPSYLQVKLSNDSTTPANLKLVIKRGKEGPYPTKPSDISRDKFQYKNSSGVFVDMPADKNPFITTRADTTHASRNLVNAEGTQTKVIDLSGMNIKDNTIRIISMSNIRQWDIDYLAVDTTPDETVTVTNEPAYSANLGFRGVSQKELTNPSDPKMKLEQPVYDTLTNAFVGNQITGNATKYGDVTSLLSDVDNKFVIMVQGDELSLKYAVPTQADGTVRDFIYKSWDYQKNYGRPLGDTILPLPFNEMSSYPYHDTESYPTDADHQVYQDTYNTRVIKFSGNGADIVPNQIHHSLNTDIFSLAVTAGPVSQPTIATPTSSSVTISGAVLNGNITANGGENSTVHGFYYGPTNSYGSQTTITASFSTGTFTSTITGLACGTTFHYQAYATNSAGTGVSPDATFITSTCPTNTNISHGGGGGGGGYIAPPTTNQPPASNTNNNSSIGNGGSGDTNPLLVLKKTLSYGNLNLTIKALQIFLNANGYIISKTGAGSPGNENNYLGLKTVAAIKKFQKANKLQQTGALGPLTRALIKKMILAGK